VRHRHQNLWLLSSTHNSNNYHSMLLNLAPHDSAFDEASNNKDSVAVPHVPVHQPSPSSQTEPLQQATTRRRPGSATYGLTAKIPAPTPYTLTQPATGPPRQPMQQSATTRQPDRHTLTTTMNNSSANSTHSNHHNTNTFSSVPCNHRCKWDRPGPGKCRSCSK
jgi:hypothetical protein